MNDIENNEAETILSFKKFAEDANIWSIGKDPFRHSISAGLVDEDGVGNGLTADLIFKVSPKTQKTQYIFTLFKYDKKTKTTMRVYQFDVKIFKKPTNNQHDLPHEHRGDKRVNLSREWTKKSFDDFFYYFCAQTNIMYKPKVEDPLRIELK